MGVNRGRAALDGVQQTPGHKHRAERPPDPACGGHAEGMRYRVDFAPLLSLRRRADLVFTSVKLAVFIDGCFWHSCHVHGTLPKTNATYWLSKLEANEVRDRDTDERLCQAGWTVRRFWEHEPAPDVAALVIAEYRGLVALQSDNASTSRTGND